MNVFEQFKRPQSDSFSSSRSSSSKDLKDLATRPIASNSRVRRDEKYMRDMYLAFVDNALTQKARVSLSLSRGISSSLTRKLGGERTL